MADSIKEDENLRRLLKTPPKPHTPLRERRVKTDQNRELNQKKKKPE
jgi:hypothetical protein